MCVRQPIYRKIVAWFQFDWQGKSTQNQLSEVRLRGALTCFENQHSECQL